MVSAAATMPGRRVQRQRSRYVPVMMRPHAVPVWIKIATDSEWTASEWVQEEERADGILRLETGRLVVEVEIVQSTTTTDGTGHAVDTERLGRRDLEIPFEEIVTVTLHGRWWLPKIRIQTNSLRPFEGLPGAKRGLVSFRIARRNWASALILIQELEFARADADLRLASAQQDTQL